MTRTRRCYGHRFLALTFNDRPVLGRWKCQFCGLKVSTRQAAEVLEGKPSL